MKANFMDSYARFSYDRMRLELPLIKTEGLYKKSNQYYIKYKDSSSKTGNALSKKDREIFDNEIRVAGCPIELVHALPPGAEKLSERSNEQVIDLSGNPLNIYSFNYQISLLLPQFFPKLWVEFDTRLNSWTVYSERPLNIPEKKHLDKSITKISGFDTVSNYKVISNIYEKIKSRSTNFFTIMLSKHSNMDVSKSLMNLWEEDEQYWADHKLNLFLGDGFQQEKNREMEVSSCLINGLNGEAYDIRNYLTLFNEVKIVLPVETSSEIFLNSLGLTQNELIALAELNRVKLILPNSIERYKKDLLEKVAAVKPDALILSREMAAKTIMNLRVRNPIVFEPQEIEEKQAVLSALIQLVSRTKENKEHEWLNNFIKELGRTWGSMYELLDQQGAMGSYHIGLGPLINSFVSTNTGRDYTLEIIGAMQSIEWSAATQSVLCPIGPLSKNEENLAYLYSGVKQNWDFDIVSHPNIVTEGLLSVANTVPVLDLAKNFKGKDVNRLRNLLVDLTQHKTQEEIEDTIQNFNKTVKQYEKRKEITASWDVKGFLLEAAVLSATTAYGTPIPFSSFVLNQLGRMLEYTGEKSDIVDKILRKTQSTIYRTPPSAVLVSKMREKINRI